MNTHKIVRRKQMLRHRMDYYNQAMQNYLDGKGTIEEVEKRLQKLREIE